MSTRCVLVGLFAIGFLAGCEAITLAGSSRVSDNVAVSVGTTVTPEGVQKPSGKVTVGIF